MGQGCRIRRVRLKRNGATIELLPSGKAKRSTEAVASLRDAVKHVCSNYEGELDGYAFVAWDRECQYMTHFWTGDGAVTRNNLAEFVKGAIIRRICESDTRKEISEYWE